MHTTVYVQETKISYFFRNSFLSRDTIGHFANRACLRSGFYMTSYMEICSVLVCPLLNT